MQSPNLEANRPTVPTSYRPAEPDDPRLPRPGASGFRGTKPICFIRDQIDKAGAQRGRRGSPSGDGVVLRVEHGGHEEGRP